MVPALDSCAVSVDIWAVSEDILLVSVVSCDFSDDIVLLLAVMVACNVAIVWDKDFILLASDAFCDMRVFICAACELSVASSCDIVLFRCAMVLFSADI